MKRKGWIVQDVETADNQPTTMRSKKQRVDLDELKWHQVNVTSDIFMNADDEMGGIMCFEEIEGVDVVVEEGLSGAKMVSFKPIQQKGQNKKKQRKETCKKQEELDLDSFFHVDAFEGDSYNEKTDVLTDKSTFISSKQTGVSKGEHPAIKENTLKKNQSKESTINESQSKNKEKKKSATKETPNNKNQINKEDYKLNPAWTSFKLNPKLEKAIAALAFEKPTEIQEKVLPIALHEQKDIIGVAETGSGKTLAFGLPLLHHCLNTPTDHVFGLIMAPTRELAMQISTHLQQLSKFTSLKMCVLVGGLSHHKQKRLIDAKPNIVVATPGRLWEWMTEDDAFRQSIQQVKYMVLDEADRMLEQGHFEEFENIMRVVEGGQHRFFLFSATLSDNNDLKLSKKKHSMTTLLSKIKFKETAHVNVIPKHNLLSKTLTETKIECLLKEKDVYLYYILTQHPGRTLIFVNAIDGIRRLVPILQLLGLNCFGLHAEMQQRQRLKNLDRFKSQPNAILVASDVAARGLDIPNVHHVIHYQLPRSADLYIHRSGRTARASKEGISVVFCAPEDLSVYKKICSALSKGFFYFKNLILDKLDDFELDRLVLAELKPHVQLAKHINSLEHATQKEAHHQHWLKQAAEEAEIMLDSDDDEPKQDDSTKAQVKQLKLQLKNMLQKQFIAPNVKRGFLSGHAGYIDQLRASLDR